MAAAGGALAGLRVLELGGLPAAAYAARLLADFGAEVVKVEPPGGDPGRDELPVLADGRGGDVGAWFAYLNHGKRSLVADLSDAAGRATVRRLLDGADLLLCSLPPADRARLGLAEGAGPAEVDLSWFGDDGPYADFAGADAVVRALAGLVRLVGPVDGPPLALPDYQAGIVGGLTGCVAALAALHAAETQGRPRRFEVGVLEANVALAEYQVAEAWTGSMRQQRRWGVNRFAPTYPLGIYPCKAGWLGVTVVTPAQWRGFCEMVGMPELARDPRYVVGPERLPHADEFEARFMPRLREKTAAEWFAIALAERLPIVEVPDMAGVLASPVFRARGAIVPVDLGGRRVEAPGSPLNLRGTPPRRGGTVPRPGEGDAVVWPSRAAAPAGAAASTLPLAGLRVVDLSMGWAGPLCTRLLGDLGCDIVKVEACQYPDWWRGVDNRPAVVEQLLYEKSGRFNVMNRNKRGITLDLTSADGVALAKALVAGADAVVENYSTGVLAKLGLDHAALRRVNPSLVMLSMAAFGATGPWKECRAYGSTLEHASGLPSVSGPADGPPVTNHLAYGDAIGGLNGAVALLIALRHRRLTGEGRQIDLSQVECMLPLAAPWLMWASATGNAGPRLGNRHPGRAPHGIFRCTGEDGWLLVATVDDAMWRALATAIGRPDLAADPGLATLAGRRQREAELEDALAAWTGERDAAAAMATLQRAGVAAGAVQAPAELYDDPHLLARGFWQPTPRAHVAGAQPQPSAAIREAGGPPPVRFPAPTLGEGNEAVLAGLLGLPAAEIARLRASGVIGERAVPPAQRKARAAAV